MNLVLKLLVMFFKKYFKITKNDQLSKILQPEKMMNIEETKSAKNFPHFITLLVNSWSWLYESWQP